MQRHAVMFALADNPDFTLFDGERSFDRGIFALGRGEFYDFRHTTSLEAPVLPEYFPPLLQMRHKRHKTSSGPYNIASRAIFHTYPKSQIHHMNDMRGRGMMVCYL